MKNQAFLDLLFEGRNKAYGAYDLRTSSDRILLKALSLGVATVTILMGGVLYSFNKPTDLNRVPEKIEGVTVTMTELEKEKKEDIVVVPPVEIPPMEVKRKQLNTDQTKHVIPDPTRDAKKQETVKNVQELVKVDLGATDRIGTEAGGKQVGGGEVSDGDKNVTGNQNTKVTEGPVTIVKETPVVKTKTITTRQATVMAIYPGCEKVKGKGNDALTKCMSERISQQLAMELEDFAQRTNEQSGTQMVAKMQFVVNQNGEIAQIKPLEGSNKDLGIESKKALDKINRTFQRRGQKIQPAQLEDGTSANLIFSIPVKFQQQ